MAHSPQAEGGVIQYRNIFNIITIVSSSVINPKFDKRYQALGQQFETQRHSKSIITCVMDI